MGFLSVKRKLGGVVMVLNLLDFVDGAHFIDFTEFLKKNISDVSFFLLRRNIEGDAALLLFVKPVNLVDRLILLLCDNDLCLPISVSSLLTLLFMGYSSVLLYVINLGRCGGGALSFTY